MASKSGQEKRDSLRLDLTSNQILGGPILNTPDLDKACEMALPTPVLNKTIMDMYGSVSTSPRKPPEQNAPTSMLLPPRPPVTESAANATTSSKPVPQTYTPQPIIILGVQTTRPSVPPSTNARVEHNVPANIVNASSLPMVPIDPSEQERLKVNRKRERNRAAAQRCREKKIQRINDLSKEVEELESQRQQFIDSLNDLENTAALTLKNVEEHQSAGCDLGAIQINNLIRDAENLRSDITAQLSSITSRAITAVYDEASTSGQG